MLPLNTIALTISVNAATFVAELFAATAGHMVAALRPLDPKVAERALFKLLTLSDCVECIIELFDIVSGEVLVTGLAFMPRLLAS